MTTDENIMEEMLSRATNPERDVVDELGVQMFCMVVRSNSQLVEKSLKMMVAKIGGQNVKEAVHAIALLEECMTKCGPDFQDEVAKFRFLNGLIRLVSKNYQGGTTHISVKQRIMECLLLWTTEFPQRSKIREAYDSLCKEGAVEHGILPTPAMAKRESILGIDEKVLARLIQSGDPENFKRANLLIQHRVNQEARRTELALQHKCELQEVQNTVALLNQMLDALEAEGGCKAVEGSETMNLIRELFMGCKKHKPILQRLPELIEGTDEDLIADTLELLDLLHAVMKRYKDTVVHPSQETADVAKVKTTAATKDTELLNATPAASNADLLTELLGDALPTPTIVASKAATVASAASLAAGSTLDDLSDIFGTKVDPTAAAAKPPPNLSELFCGIDLLEPINVFEESKKSSIALNDGGNSPEKRAMRELRAIDQMSEALFKENLQSSDRIGSFKKDTEKVTLNDLAKDQKVPRTFTKTTPKQSISPAKCAESLKNSLEIDLDALKQQTPETISTDQMQQSQPDELMLSSATTQAQNPDETKIPCNLNNANGAAEVPPESNGHNEPLPYKHLSDISIDLDNVTPTAQDSLLLDDDDLKITLNFTADRPSQHVSVIVISVLNKSKMPVHDFQFEASVKKPCKVRLLPPSETVMPACRPFRPPTPITQVMLLLNPTRQSVDVTCIVGYKLGDDPDPVKESIVARAIPFVE